MLMFLNDCAVDYYGNNYMVNKADSSQAQLF